MGEQVGTQVGEQVGAHEREKGRGQQCYEAMGL